MLGIRSTTIEVNPFLVDVIRSKLARYDVDSLASALAHVRIKSRRATPDPATYFAATPPTFVEPGVRDRWIFDSAVAARLAALLHAINSLEDAVLMRLFRVVVGGLLAQSSNVLISGKGRRYRRNWQSAPVKPERVNLLFSERAERAILDIQQFSARFKADSNVIQGDARAVNLQEQYQLSVLSPPYPNSFDYTDVYNLELWMLGYLGASGDNKALRNATITSHVQLSRAYDPVPNGSDTLDLVHSKLESRQDALWNRWIPAMVGGYFADLLKVLERIRNRLSENGKCWMVVGDSSYSGVTVPVAKILGELVVLHGWSVSESKPFRHMKSSAQQGWRPELAESLLVMQKK